MLWFTYSQKKDLGAGTPYRFADVSSFYAQAIKGYGCRDTLLLLRLCEMFYEVFETPDFSL